MLGKLLTSETHHTIYETGEVPSDFPLHVGWRELSGKDRKASVKHKVLQKIRYYDTCMQIWQNGSLVTHNIFLGNLVRVIVLCGLRVHFDDCEFRTNSNFRFIEN